MKANEFIKKFGIDEASEIVIDIPDKFKFKCLSNTCWDTNTYKYSDRFKPRNSLVNIADLKRLVESHELVESYGGLDLARKEAHKDCFGFNAPLLKSILDVESCM